MMLNRLIGAIDNTIRQMRRGGCEHSAPHCDGAQMLDRDEQNRLGFGLNGEQLALEGGKASRRSLNRDRN